MKKLILLAVLIYITGCASMGEGERKIAWVVIGVVATAVVLSADDNSASQPGCIRSIIIRSDGTSDQVCR